MKKIDKTQKQVRMLQDPRRARRTPKEKKRPLEGPRAAALGCLLALFFFAHTMGGFNASGLNPPLGSMPLGPRRFYTDVQRDNFALPHAPGGGLIYVFPRVKAFSPVAVAMA